MIKNIQFRPIKPKDGLIGFISFDYDNKFYFSSIGIYTKKNEVGYS